MNIQALSDTELNRAMIWLYPPEGKHAHINDKHWVAYEGAINYLLNWNLTMPLAVEHGLEITLSTDIARVENGYDGYVANNKNPLRAICEVLVMIGMEGK